MMIKLLMILMMNSCSTFVQSEPIQDFQYRKYRICEPEEAKEGPFEEKDAWKFRCWNQCLKWKFLHSKISENCKKWHRSHYDMTVEKNVMKFKNANFMIKK